MLTLENGEIFANGATIYEFRSVTPDEEQNKRIILPVSIDGLLSMAVIDTGAPYLIIDPVTTERLGLVDEVALERTEIRIRGVKYSGKLFRLDVQLNAVEGENLGFQATAFVPDPGQEDKWGELPSFLGIEHCLERVRFAIDPGQYKFHFGALP